MATAQTLVTLKGYLGKDPQTRSTEERTYTATRYNEVAEMEEPYDVHVPPRDYIVLSLAVRSGATTLWHRLVVWDADRVCHRNIRLSRVGDFVEVTGYPDSWTPGGTDKVIEQVVVTSLRRLRLSRKHRAPEIP